MTGEDAIGKGVVPTDDADAAALAAAKPFFDQIRRWQEQNGAAIAKVQPGSDLDGDDRGLGYLQLSHVATTSIVAAVDEMDALRRLVVDAHAITAFAPFTLIRAGLENGAVAVWLLAPDHRQERQRRRLFLALQDNYDQRQVSDIIRDDRGEPVYGKRRNDISQLAADLAIELPERRPFPGYEAVVSVAGDYLSRVRSKDAFYRRRDAALAVWKVCSGMAHGAQWVTASLLQQRLVELDTVEGVRTSSASAPVATIVSGGAVAVDMIREAYRLRERRRLKFTEH